MIMANTAHGSPGPIAILGGGNVFPRACFQRAIAVPGPALVN